jgi:hypothetical protein
MLVHVLIAVIALAVAVAVIKRLRSRSVGSDDTEDVPPEQDITEERRISLFTTTDTLPSFCQIVEMFGIVQVEIWHRVEDEKDNPYQRALDRLAAWSPKEANAIIGIKVSMATYNGRAYGGGGGGGTTHIIRTYTGTPVRFRREGEAPNAQTADSGANP